MRRTRVTGGAAALCSVALLAAGCASAPRGGEVGVTSSSAVVAPDIADVSPVADPRAFEGPVVAGVGDSEVVPVGDDVESRLPVTLTDAQGTKVTVRDTSRVLALDIHGTLARTVFELGLGDQLVGRDVSTQFDEAAGLPLVTGNGHELNAEAILDLDPTLILTDTSLGPWDVVLQLREAGIPIVVVDSDRSLDNVADITQMTAAALGVPKAGAALAAREQSEIDAVTEAIEAKAPEPAERLRTVFLYVRGGAGVYYMFGEGSGADDLIEAAGGYDVAEEIKWRGMRPITSEGLVAAAPEVVVMMTGGLESVGGADALMDELPALAQTPAGQNRRIITMDDSLILGYGPLTARVLNALAVGILAPQELT